jgi:hypothetical protein
MYTFTDVNGKLIYRFTDGTCFYADGFEQNSEHVTLATGVEHVIAATREDGYSHVREFTGI